MGEDQKHCEQTSGKAPADGPGRKTFPAAYRVPCNGKQKEAAHKAVPVIEHSVFCEAMKLMNEVTADCDGTVKEVAAENGTMVEYGQPLVILN